MSICLRSLHRNVSRKLLQPSTALSEVKILHKLSHVSRYGHVTLVARLHQCTNGNFSFTVSALDKRNRHLLGNLKLGSDYLYYCIIFTHYTR